MSAYTRFGETGETLASELADEVRERLGAILSGLDEGAGIDVLAEAIEAYRAELGVDARRYHYDESVAENARWAYNATMCDEVFQEGRQSAQEAVEDAYRDHGPVGERLCDWRRTMAEPWATIAVGLSQ